jgi:HK97 family phage prohead protease
LIHIDAADMRFMERMNQRIYGRHGRALPRPVAEDDDDHEPRLCVEGIAVLTDEPIGTKTGTILVIEQGAFDDHFASGSRTEMWLAHKSSEVICSTASGLEFAKTTNGLAFRFPLTNKLYADKVKRMVESGKQAAVSVGIIRLKERQEQIGRHTVTFVEKARLEECSIVLAGACPEAFCRLIDANHAPSLAESVKSVPFKIDSGMHNAKTQREKNATWAERLSLRLEAMERGRDTFSQRQRLTHCARHRDP